VLYDIAAGCRSSPEEIFTFKVLKIAESKNAGLTSLGCVSYRIILVIPSPLYRFLLVTLFRLNLVVVRWCTVKFVQTQILSFVIVYGFVSSKELLLSVMIRISLSWLFEGAS